MIKYLINQASKYVYNLFYRKQYPYLIDYIYNEVFVTPSVYAYQIKYLEEMMLMMSLVYPIKINNIWAFYHDFNYKNNVHRVHKLGSLEFFEHCRKFEDHLKENKGIVCQSKK